MNAIAWDQLLERWPWFALAVALAALIYLVSNRLILSLMKKRLQRLDHVEHFDAVPTASPYKDPEHRARKSASQAIRLRYSVIRSILALGLLAMLALFFLLPMLDAIPQALVSFLVALAIGVVGVATRPLVENLIAGAVLSFSNQLRIGDTVLLDEQHYGTVEDIHATHTVLKLWDWRRYVIPNSAMLNKEIVHFTHKDQYLWAHVEFWVSGRADLSLVEKIAITGAKNSDYFAEYGEPQFWVRDFTPTAIKCWVAAWARSPEDAWYLRADIRRFIADGFRARGIDTHLESISLKDRDDVERDSLQDLKVQS